MLSSRLLSSQRMSPYSGTSSAGLKTSEEKQHQQRAIRQGILTSLLQLRHLDVQPYGVKQPEQPHVSGRNGTSVTVSAIDDNLFSQGSLVTLRPAYTDKLDPDIGKIANSTLKMGSISFRQSNGTNRLDHITFFEVENLTTSGLNYKLDAERVWHLAAGVKRDTFNPQASLKPYAVFGIGKDLTIHKSLSAYAMLETQVSQSTKTFGAVRPSLRVGVIMNPHIRVKLSLENEIFHTRKEKQYSRNFMTIRYTLSKRFDLRVGYIGDSQNQRQIALGVTRHF